MKHETYQLGYRSDIEGLRALAILLVVGAHAGVPWLAGGFVGVDVFFVLSGFLITGLLLREMTETGGVDFSGFYLRRLRRLMPALLFMVIVTSAIAVVVLPPGEQLQQPVAAAMATMWMSNIHFALETLDYFAPGADANLFLHTWSLGVEEQFYLVWPWLLLGFASGRLERIFLVRAVMLGLIVSGLIASDVLTRYFPQWAFYMMPVRAWEFASGALVWLGVRGNTHGLYGQRIHVALKRSVGWIGLAMVVVSALVYGSNTSYPGWRAAIPVFGTVAIVWAGSHGHVVGVSRLLSAPPMQWLGRVSYSWYLWHWPLLLLAAAQMGSHDPWIRAGAVAIALLVAIASQRWLESPMRRQLWWFKRPRMTWLASIAVMAFAWLMTDRWSTVASAHLERPAVQKYTQARFDMPIIYARGCDDYFRSSELHPCVFGRPDATHTVVLIGDSIAGQWFPAVSKVFDGVDWRIVVLTKSACPMVDEPFVMARIGRIYKECSDWRQSALTYVAAIRPDAVLLSTVATDGFDESQWTDGTARVLDRIVGSADRIFVLRGTPRLPFDGPDCLISRADKPVSAGLLQACHSHATDPRDELVKQWLQRASSKYKNVSFIDMNDLVCPGGICAAEIAGVVVFRDAQHMTASFTSSLAPELERRLGLNTVTTLNRPNGI